MPGKLITEEQIMERIAIMLEDQPDVTTEELLEAARALRGQEPLLAQRLARREQDAGRDGRQVMRAVQWVASHWDAMCHPADSAGPASPA